MGLPLRVEGPGLRARARRHRAAVRRRLHGPVRRRLPHLLSARRWTAAVRVCWCPFDTRWMGWHRSTAAFPRITPVEPPIVNINKKRSAKSAELVLSCNNGGFPRYVLNQLKIFVPVGKDIKTVTPVK